MVAIKPFLTNIHTFLLAYIVANNGNISKIIQTKVRQPTILKFKGKILDNFGKNKLTKKYETKVGTGKRNSTL